jgi:hypothetical protein
LPKFLRLMIAAIAAAAGLVILALRRLLDSAISD